LGVLSSDPPLKLAQGILCGAWALAFPFDWARQIVDEFELSPIPKAPDWLMGGVNVDGTILPVVDLARYLGTAPVQAMAHQQRLLIGGLTGGLLVDDTGDAVALAFEGLPQQLSYEPRELTYAAALPARLRELCSAVCSNAAGQEYLEIDAQRLVSALSDELSQI
jgi:chemotaxis signal transduction protein